MDDRSNDVIGNLITILQDPARAHEVYRLVNLRLRELCSRPVAELREERSRKIAALTVNGSITQSTREYYLPGMSQDSPISLYSVSVEGRPAHTPIAVHRDLSWPSAGAVELSAQCVIRNRSIPTPDIPNSEMARYVAILAVMNQTIWPNPSYNMTSLARQDAVVSAEFSVIDFLQYRYTFGLMLDELLEYLVQRDVHTTAGNDDLSSHMPLRTKLLPTLESAFAVGTRVCAGGPVVLFALARPAPHEDYCIYTIDRSPNVGEGQHMLSVVPQGFHQPMTADFDSEVDIRSTVFRELYEELFRGRAVERDAVRVEHDWYFDESEPMRWFRENEDKYTLDLLSIGMNCTQGNYEYAFLLAVHDESFIRQFGGQVEGNWEAKRQGIRKHSTLKPEELAALIHVPSWAGGGLLALVEGLRRLHEIDPKRVRLPAIERC